MTKTRKSEKELQRQKRSREALAAVRAECHPGGRPVATAVRLASEMDMGDGVRATNEAFQNLEDRIIALETKP